MDNRVEVEILGDGPDDRGPRSRRRPPAGLRLRPPGGWTRAHRTAAAVTGAVLLAGTGIAAVRLVPDQPFPSVVVNSSTIEERAPRFVQPWNAGADGRPATPVTLALAPTVSRGVVPGHDDTAGVELQVVGLAGPGVTGNEAPPTAVPATVESVLVPVRARIDCSRVPGTITDDAYGLSVRASFGSRHRTQVATDLDAGRVWAGRVLGACSAWRARRALTISGLTARPHPGRSALDVSFTVANSGDRRAMLTDQASLAAAAPFSTPATGAAQLPVSVPPHGSAPATVTLDLSDCGVAGPPGPGPVLSDVVGLVASSGEERPWGPDDVFGAAIANTGVVLSGDAAGALRRGLVAACGGLEPPVLSVPTGGIRRGPEPGEILMDVDARVAPGRVLSLTLDLDLSGEASLESGDRFLTESQSIRLTPLDGVRTLVPDASGRARATVHLRAPQSDTPCSQVTLTLAAPVLTARIREGARERDLRYTASLGVRKERFEPLVCRRDR